MKAFRIGVVGSGFMGLTHAAAADQVEGVELAGIAGGRRAAALAEQHGVVEERDSAALADRDDVDALIITTPHHLHAEDTIYALNRGKHVLVEKPMATTLEDCDAMIEAARRSGCTLALGFQQRYRNNNREACRLVQEGALGDVLLVQVNMLPSVAPMLADPGFEKSWHWWQDARSVGHILNSGPHAIDLIRWMLKSEVTQVSALCRTTRPDAQVEDTTAAVVGFANGTICALTSSCVAPDPSFPGEEFRFRLMGSKAVLDLDPYGEVRLSKDGKLQTVSVQPPVGHQEVGTLTGERRMQAYNAQLRDFVALTRGLPSEIGTAADGRAAVAACLAMLETSAAMQR